MMVMFCLTGDGKVCNPVEWQRCYQVAHDNFTEDPHHREECDCRRECYRKEYVYTLSSAPISDYFYSIFRSFLRVSEEYLKKNFVQVSIYFTETAYVSKTMEPAYTILALVCDVGGALGLILGSTLLTFIEIAEFIINIIYVISGKRAKVGLSSN